MGESTIVIPADLMKQLEALSEQEDRPIADIMRDAIRL
jgi:predicted DNA-binding protein